MMGEVMNVSMNSFLKGRDINYYSLNFHDVKQSVYSIDWSSWWKEVRQLGTLLEICRAAYE
jgi:hypothetical protein